MDLKEAYRILGLPFGANRSCIEEVYRAAMQGLQPSGGPYSYISAEVVARDHQRLSDRRNLIEQAYQYALRSQDRFSQAAPPPFQSNKDLEFACVYEGFDPRVRMSSRSIGFNGDRVEITRFGIVLLTAEKAIAYPADSIWILWEPDGQWNSPSRPPFEATPPPDSLCLHCVCLLVADPGEVESSIVVKLCFKDRYYARRFVGRACDVLGLVADAATVRELADRAHGVVIEPDHEVTSQKKPLEGWQKWADDRFVIWMLLGMSLLAAFGIWSFLQRTTPDDPYIDAPRGQSRGGDDW